MSMRRRRPKGPSGSPALAHAGARMLRSSTRAACSRSPEPATRPTRPGHCALRSRPGQVPHSNRSTLSSASGHGLKDSGLWLGLASRLMTSATSWWCRFRLPEILRMDTSWPRRSAGPSRVGGLAPSRVCGRPDREPVMSCCILAPSRVLGRTPSSSCSRPASRVEGLSPPSGAVGRRPSAVRVCRRPSCVRGRPTSRALEGHSRGSSNSASGTSRRAAQCGGSSARTGGTLALELEEGAEQFVVGREPLQVVSASPSSWRSCCSRISTPAAASRRDLPIAPSGALESERCTVRSSA
mmetsp:Transcript_111500/g.315338  ORF Transcript_111500/g.315338 Transcript_111500/m.315338 type:complete len:297 (-) Transcript_111500:96-986(-)